MTTQPDETPTPEAFQYDDQSDTLEMESSPEIYTLNSPIPAIEKPEGTTWRLSDGANGLVLTQHGQWQWLSLFMLFFTVFWNGVVSVFLNLLFGVLPGASEVLPFFSPMWWGLAVFLLPFVTVGLVLLWGLLFLLLRPLWKRKLVLQSTKIWSRQSLFFGLLGIGHSYDLEECRTFEIAPEKTIGLVPVSVACVYHLKFRDANGKCLLAIKNLTHDEALWILREYRYCGSAGY